MIQKFLQPMVSKITFLNQRTPAFPSSKAIVISAFLGFLLLGLAIVRDYGIHWDEPGWRQTGHIFLRGLLAKDTAFLTHPNRYAGTAFEMLAAAAENLFRFSHDDRKAYFLRHHLVFLTFFLGVLVFYQLLRNAFHDWRWGLLGCTLLVASPRIFADSFYNSKDIVFLSVFIMSMYSLMGIIRQPRPFTLIGHGLISAFLIGIRSFGISVFLVTLLILFGKRPSRERLINLTNFLLPFFLLLLMIFPILWHNPMQQLGEAMTMAIPHPWLSEVLYNGQFIRLDQLPWHYAPCWILITTPIAYILFFFVGLIYSAYLIIRKIRVDKSYLILALLWFFCPLLIALIFQRMLYDGWRHFFFIYPALILIAIQGFKFLWDSGQKFKSPLGCFLARSVLAIILLSNISSTLYFMIRYHPFQNVYFNRLAGKNLAEIKRNFDLGYWGLSYRQALEFIVTHDPREQIFIQSANLPGMINATILPPDDRRRLVFVDHIKDAEYFITNYRWQNLDIAYPGKIFSVSVRGTDIVSVFKKM